MADQKEKCVLAYSGGLDTSCCIKWLQEEKNVDVIAVVGEVGQEHDGLEKVRQKALATGAIACHVVDMREGFANEYLSQARWRPTACTRTSYPLVSALSRSAHLQAPRPTSRTSTAPSTSPTAAPARATTRCASRRASSRSIPSLEILAPVREWDLRTPPQGDRLGARAAASRYRQPTAKPYSIDDNLWGRAIECGVLEDPWNEPPADIYTMTTDPEAAPDEAEYVEISFEKGIPCAHQRREEELPRHRLRPQRDRRPQRLRPPRHDREPPRGREEPRVLRGCPPRWR